MSPLQHLLCYANEQEWMRLDFAEERRWKRVLAREFAYQVVEWHLSSPRDKASLMVGGIGWGARRALAAKPKPKTNGKAASEIKDKESVEDDVAMEEEAEEENTGGQVLDEIMPRRATRGRKPKRRTDAEEDLTPEPELNPASTKDADVEMDEDEAEPTAKIADDAQVPEAAVVENTEKPISAKSVPQPDPDADAEGEVDAEGEADAEGEVDAQGEDDGESADVVDGVIGLGGKSTPIRRT
jgi:chromatin modification-related protein VID21